MPPADGQRPKAGDGCTWGRERVLFTTRERILAGDFRMLRAPSDPLEVRELRVIDGRAPFFTVEDEFDLVALAKQPPDDALAA
jgi:hypothetical protein